jgi:hypothetical protein
MKTIKLTFMLFFAATSVAHATDFDCKTGKYFSANFHGTTEIVTDASRDEMMKIPEIKYSVAKDGSVTINYVEDDYSAKFFGMFFRNRVSHEDFSWVLPADTAKIDPKSLINDRVRPVDTSKLEALAVQVRGTEELIKKFETLSNHYQKNSKNDSAAENVNKALQCVISKARTELGLERDLYNRAAFPNIEIAPADLLVVPLKKRDYSPAAYRYGAGDDSGPE